MRLPIEVSATMTHESAGNEQFENRIIRVSERGRERYGLPLGSFVHLRAKDGSLLALQVVPAFLEDSAKSSEAAFVTTSTLQQLAVANHSIHEVQRVEGITLGCDPEAFLVERSSGHLVSATRFFRRIGEVGHDGMLLEFRPRPSVDADLVTRYIWHLIVRAREALNRHPEGNKIAMVGSSAHQGLTAGFHLHYGLPNVMLGRRAPVRHLANLMVHLFDYYIGIPSILPEGEIDHHRRTVPYVDYGKPGGFRLDSRTFEFRLPGGILLRHPTLTRGIMALGAVVVEDFVSRLRERTDNFLAIKEVKHLTDIRELYPNLPEPIDIHHMIVTISLQAARERMMTIANDIRSMVGYKERSDAVEDFFRCIADGVTFSNDIFNNWGAYYNAEHQREMGIL